MSSSVDWTLSVGEAVWDELSDGEMDVRNGHDDERKAKAAHNEPVPIETDNDNDDDDLLSDGELPPWSRIDSSFGEVYN